MCVEGSGMCVDGEIIVWRDCQCVLVESVIVYPRDVQPTKREPNVSLSMSDVALQSSVHKTRMLVGL
jgi:hypothetical protein